MKLTIEKLDALELFPVFFNLRRAVFPAEEIVSSYKGTPLRITFEGTRLRAYEGRYCVANFGDYIRLGQIETKTLGLAGKILEFFHALQNRPIPYVPEVWDVDCEPYYAEGPDIVWNARDKLRVYPKRDVKNPRGQIEADRFIPAHEARRQVLERTALARGLRIDEYLPNGKCIAWVPIEEFWQGPCRRR